MRIALRLAIRDLRRGGGGLLLLVLCLFLGTAALAGIGSLSASMLAALDAQGRTMLGGDVELTVSQRSATVAESAIFAKAGLLSTTIGMRAMADPGGGRAPALVSLRGVDAAWPLVGRLRLAPGGRRPRGLEVAVAPVLADRMALRVGSPLRIGAARLRVSGVIADEPDRLGAGFTLGPSVIVDMDGLQATELVQPGSLYESRYHILLPAHADQDAVRTALVARVPDAGWSGRTSAQAAGGLKRGIAQLGQFLLLVGLAALAIAGVGVASGVGGYLGAKTRIIATLKVLGADGRTIATLFLSQLALVASVGIGAGVAFGAAVPWIVVLAAGDALPVPPRIALYPAPLGIATGLSAIVALLARARQVPAATLLRDSVAARTLPSLRVMGGMALLLALLVALSVLTASDASLALGFVAGTAATIVLLWSAGLAIRAVAARLPRSRRPLLRLAVANLHRPGAQTDRLVVALGLGFSLFVGLATIDTSVSAELRDTAPAAAPRFFAIDLQPDDATRFRQVVAAAAPGARIEAVPSLRGSIVALKGVRVADMKTLPANWVLRGDRTLTWSATVPPRNAVVAGRWWPAGYRGSPLVSIEDRTAEALGLHVGDRITISVLGVDIPARIAALRKIDWGGLGLNFAIIFSPGYIEEAPHGLLASVYAAPSRDGAIARDVAAALPSVTLVRVGDVIGQIGELLAKIALAIRAAGAVTVAAGIAVLVGAVAASGRTRRYDATILKLLGGSSAQVLAAQAIEYVLLSLILVGVALTVGGAAGWYVVTRVFQLGWAPDWGVVALTLAAATVVTLGIGLIGSLSALRARPAAILRTL